MHAFLRTTPGSYVFAAVAVAIAGSIRAALDPIFDDRFPYALFLFAVVAVAFLGRVGPALFALGLGTALGTYLFVSPRYTVALVKPGNVPGLTLTLIGGVVLAILADTLRRARERLRLAAAAQSAQDERVRAERARLKEMMDSIPGIVWETWGAPSSKEERVNYVSNYVEQMLGYTAAEWRAEPNGWLQRVVPEDRERAARVASEKFASGQPGENEFRLMTKDGRTRWVSTRSWVIKDGFGVPVGTRGVTFDVTDRKEAEQRLALLAEISTTALTTPSFHELAQRIAQRTANVIGDYCIIRLQRDGRLEGIAFAHTSPEATPLMRKFTTHPDVMSDNALYAEVMRQPRTLVDNEVSSSIFGSVDLSGVESLFERFRPRRGIICPLLGHGKVLGTLALGRAAGPPYNETDVSLVEAIASRATLALDNAVLFETAQREAEEADRARSEAEEAGRVKDEFLATLSHELRTPLNAILGWAHLLRDPTLPDDRRRSAIETIVRNAQSQEQLISDILDVQRIMAGKIRLSMRNVDLGAIIRAAAETVQPFAAAKNVRLQLLLDLDVPSLWGDPDRLQQVVCNLLNNGIKFSPPGGRVQVRLLRGASDCDLVVEDNGPGIDSEFLPFVFERFRQADSSTTRTHKGLGLGLAIVRSLVEMHGGTITASNVSGQSTGALFTIRLPLHRPRVQHHSDADLDMEQESPVGLGEAPPLDGLRILVVEDDSDARELIGAILERCGAHVTLTKSSYEGFNAFMERRPDVMVSDIEMPEEDGYDLIRRIRALAPNEGGEVPAAALTAYVGSADRIKVLGAGFNIHVAKPVQPAELATVVASLAGRRSAGVVGVSAEAKNEKE